MTQQRKATFPQAGDRVELLADWGFNTPYLRAGHKGTVTVVGEGSTGVMVLMDEDPTQTPWAMSLLDIMPAGQLCERLRNYSTHEAHSAWQGPRGAHCPRPAKAKDKNGDWACGVHIGADKRGDQARIRAQKRWGTYRRGKED